MDDWQKDFYKVLNNISSEIDQIFNNVSDAINGVADEINETFIYINETVNFLTEEIQNTISSDFNEFLNEIFDPFLEIYHDLEEINFDADQGEGDFSINPKVEPTADRFPACIGCRNYHGRIYEGNILVCGMHPYGWDDAHCPDWEAKSKN